MRGFFLSSCLILCSCPFGEEAELVPSSANIIAAPDSSNVLPSSSSVGPERSLYDCPPGDVAAEYPPSGPPDNTGWCKETLNLSVNELSFDAKGGTRCLVTSHKYGLAGARGCVRLANSMTTACPWLTITQGVSYDPRILHISVNRNATGKERKMQVALGVGAGAGGHKCYSGNFTITQSADTVMSISSNVLPSSSSVGPERPILDCPPEDIADEYPTLGPPGPMGSNKDPNFGWCERTLGLSINKLSFDAKGGVRCLVASHNFWPIKANKCAMLENSTTMACPWLNITANVYYNPRILHISVNRNATGKERNILVNLGGYGNPCHIGNFTITQSAD